MKRPVWSHESHGSDGSIYVYYRRPDGSLLRFRVPPPSERRHR